MRTRKTLIFWANLMGDRNILDVLHVRLSGSVQFMFSFNNIMKRISNTFLFMATINVLLLII
jgi:hypothetical protein